MPRLRDRYFRRPGTAVITAVRRRPLVSSTALVVLGLVAVAPRWWWRQFLTAQAAVGRHWLAVLLLVVGLAGLMIHGAATLHRRRRPDTARRRRREPVAVWLPLSAHVAGLLLIAVLVAAAVAALLWWALGSPTVYPTPAATPPVGAPAPAGAWTVQNTFDAMKIVLSVVAGIGAVVALTVAYRKQDQGEAAEHREDTKLFNERFGRAADQLGAEQAAVRLAGVHAMAGLADDWTDGQQTCIDVLCAYLRMPYTPPNEPSPSPPSTSPPEPPPEIRPSIPGRDPVEERQVRHTVLRLIRDHLRPRANDNDPRWHRRHFDLTGAVIDGGDLSHIEVPAKTILDFTRASFSGGTVDFSYATFSGGWVDFRYATFSGGRVDFRFATFSGSTVDLTRAKFSGGTVNFHGASFSGGRVDFRYATFSGSTVNFPGATFSDGTVDLTRATFSGGWVDFSSATFSDGRVEFSSASFSGGRVDFRYATFSGSTGDLAWPRDWSSPPVGLDRASPGVLMPLSGTPRQDR